MQPDPLILAFDTSAAHCAAALLCGERVLGHVNEPMARGQAERLMPLLEELLASAGSSWDALTAIGVCTGPGNFTGVRISVAAARGLALALGRPAIGVTRLEALAEGHEGPVLALIDARQERLYAEGFGPGMEGAPEITDVGSLAARDWPRGLGIVGASAGALAERLGARLLGARLLGEDDMPDARVLARIAAARLGRPVPRPAPLYLRAADAALPSEKPPRIIA